jgi:hypothetical protein
VERGKINEYNFIMGFKWMGRTRNICLGIVQGIGLTMRVRNRVVR